MNKLITFKQAILYSKILFGVIMVFHLGVIVGILLFDYAPVDFLWGGRMETGSELLRFEILSLVIIIFCLVTVMVRAQEIKLPKLIKLSRIILWVLTMLFVFNTIGNMLAASTFEKFFALITILLAFLCFRLAMEPVKKE